METTKNPLKETLQGKEQQKDPSMKKELSNLKNEVINKKNKKEELINPQNKNVDQTDQEQQTPEELQKLIDTYYGYLTYNTQQLRQAMEDAPNNNYNKEFNKKEYYNEVKNEFVFFSHGLYSAYININAKNLDFYISLHFSNTNTNTNYIIFDSNEKEMTIESVKKDIVITPDNINNRLPIIKRVNDAVYFARQRQLKRNQQEFEKMKKF